MGFEVWVLDFGFWIVFIVGMGMGSRRDGWMDEREELEKKERAKSRDGVEGDYSKGGREYK